MVVAGADQAEAIEAALPELGALILEPAARNTAPAIALAALAADADDVLLVLPSDHLIGDAAGFRDAVAPRLAVRAGRLDRHLRDEGRARPRPAMAISSAARRWARASTRRCASSRSPTPRPPRRYVAGGRHDWNGGIFLMRAGTYLDALGAHAPEIAGGGRGGDGRGRRKGRRILPDAAAFAASPALSIDYAVMEKADKVAVVPVAIGWSDVGSWDALLRRFGARRRPAMRSPATCWRSTRSGCLIRSDGPLVAAIGVEDLS